MSVQAIIIAAVVVGAVGIILGFFLGVSGEKLKVEVDPREEEILGVLPGNNCGGCGYPGCSGLAAAIVAGEAPVGQCPVGGDPVAAKVGKIMGVEAGSGKKMVAFVKCAGSCDKAKTAYEYTGITECTAMKYLPGGGPKACAFGCLGFGTCTSVCPFDAIHVIDGIAVVDKEACKACKKCIEACPRNLIELVPYDAEYKVRCSSKNKGKEVMAVCQTGCIGCGLCAKNCPSGAITVENNIAHIDQEKCTGCGTCAAKCPKKVITGVVTEPLKKEA